MKQLLVLIALTVSVFAWACSRMGKDVDLDSNQGVTADTFGVGVDGDGSCNPVGDAGDGSVGWHPMGDAGDSSVGWHPMGDAGDGDGGGGWYPEATRETAASTGIQKATADAFTEMTPVCNAKRDLEFRYSRPKKIPGAFYLGSAAYPFRKPATPGQRIEWKP